MESQWHILFLYTGIHKIPNWDTFTKNFKIEFCNQICVFLVYLNWILILEHFETNFFLRRIVVKNFYTCIK